MTAVSLRTISETLDSQFRSLSRVVKENISARISSNSSSTAETVLEYFFDSYNIRNQYFGRQKDDFVIINLDLNSETDIESLDQIVLLKLNQEINHYFSSISEAARFCKSHEITPVAIVKGTNPSLFRYLLSYTFMFGGKFVFLDISEINHDYFSQSVDLYIPLNAFKELVERRIKEFGVSVSADEIMAAVGGDIAKIDKAIFDTRNPAKKIESDMLPDREQVKQPVVFSEPEVTKPLRESEEELKKDIQLVNVPKQQPAPVEQKPQLVSAIRVDAAAHDAAVQPVSFDNVGLTAREQSIYSLLKKKNFISRSEIAQTVWGSTDVSDDAIDQVISRLRRKFVKAGFSKSYISSKKGEGIMLVENS